MTVGRVIRATLFPYTTLFRSEVGGVEGLPAAAGGGGDGVHGGGPASGGEGGGGRGRSGRDRSRRGDVAGQVQRSEEYTSELQSRLHVVCRLMRDTKNTNEEIT